MTISYIEPVITYVSSGNGNYPFTFKILAESDIEVWYTSASTGARVQLVRGADFSVTVSNPGGTVTILDNAPAGGQILIARRVPIDQPTDWVNNGPFDMDLLEADLDRIIMIVQQLDWEVSSGQAALNFRGPWVTTTTYTSRDIVRASNGNYYFCIVNHTSGTFATDLAAGNWVLFIDFDNPHAITPVQLGLGRKNLLINGGFDVWQRGTSFSSASVDEYAADRWLYDPITYAATTITRQSLAAGEAGALFTSRYYMRVAIVTSNNRLQTVKQRIENLMRFSGRTVTLSWYAKASVPAVNNMGATLNMIYNAAELSPTPHYVCHTASSSMATTTSWQRYTRTFEIPDATHGAPETLTAHSCLEVRIDLITQNANTTYDIADVQLEFGDTATNFEYRHPAEELMLCQRYYETGSDGIPKVANMLGDNILRVNAIPFKVTKRMAPAMTIGTLTPSGHDGTQGPINATYQSTDEFCAQWDWTGGTAGRAVSAQFTWIANAEL